MTDAVLYAESYAFGVSVQSTTMAAAGSVKIELVTANETTVLKDEVVLQAGEVIDASSMSVKALRAFYAAEIQDAKVQKKTKNWIARFLPGSLSFGCSELRLRRPCVWSARHSVECA